MNRKRLSRPQTQSMATDKFFYFFLGLRKGEIRRRVAALQKRHPEERPDQLARRLIAAHIPLSLLGGALLHGPMFLPGMGHALKLFGVVGGTSVMMRMHLSLILEIALLFGKDIDDRARLREMVTVMAATGLLSGMPFLIRALEINPWYSIASGGLAVTSFSQLIGESAIRYYLGTLKASPPSPSSDPVGVPTQKT